MSKCGGPAPGAKLSPDDPFFDIIQDAYREFTVPKPSTTDVCDCCMDKDIEADFFNPPVEELPLTYVRDWYFAAYQPPGVSKSTWTYLLPRILEILATGEDVASVGLEVSLARFQTGNPDHWRASQWSVLDRFQRAYFLRAMTGDSAPIDDVLCMFGLGGWPVDGLVRQLDDMPTQILAERFWRDWCEGASPGREAVWVTAFWGDGANSATYDFYASRKLYDRLTAFGLAEDTPAELAEKALAVAMVIEKETEWVGD